MNGNFYPQIFGRNIQWKYSIITFHDNNNSKITLKLIVMYLLSITYNNNEDKTKRTKRKNSSQGPSAKKQKK